MTVRDAAWLSLGALAFPLGYRLAARLAGKHYLDIKEQP
jgi:hypothetical protein